MNKLHVISPFISLVIALTIYISLNSILYALLAAACVYLFMIFYCRYFLLRHYQKINRFHELYHFVNTYIISLNVLKSNTQALEASLLTIQIDHNDELSLINHLSDNEKFIYLKKYFRFHIYQLFTDVISIWLEEGGDVIKMTNHIVNQLREYEDYIAFNESVSKRRIVEFGILWLFSLMILVVLRFSLSDFYDSFLKNNIFIIGVLSMVVIFIASIAVLINRITNVNLEGWTNEK